MGKTYVVFVGRNPGIYRTWEETQMQVHKYSGCLHQAYPTREEAVAVFTAYKEKQARSSSTSATAPTSASVSASASSSTTSSSSTTVGEQYEKLGKLIDAQIDLAREHRKQCLKAAGMFEEIEQQLKSLRVKEDDN